MANHFINSPLHLGAKGTSVSNIHKILDFAIQTISISGVDELRSYINGYENEKKNNYFGNYTCSLLSFFGDSISTSFIDTAFPLINETISDELIDFYIEASPNNELEEIEIRKIRGVVVNFNSKPLTDITVKAFDVDFRADDTQIGATATTNSDGSFVITYQVADYESAEYKSNSADIKVIAYDTDGTTPLATSIIYFNAPKDLNIELIVSNDAAAAIIKAEFNDIHDKVALITGEIDFTTLTEDEIIFLSREMEENIYLIKYFVQAYKLHNQLETVDVDYFYGLLRQNQPDSLAGLVNQSSEALSNAIIISINTDIIYKPLATVEEIVALIKNSFYSLIVPLESATAADSRTYNLLKLTLSDGESDNEVKRFLDHFYANNENIDDEFWDNLHTEIDIEPEAAIKLKKSVHFGLLTNNNPALIDELIGIGDTGNNPSQFVAKSLEEWEDLIDHHITDDSFAYPDDISSDDTLDSTGKKEAYAIRLKNNFDSAFPSEYFIAKLSADTIDETHPFAAFSDFITNPSNSLYNLKEIPASLLRNAESDYDFGSDEEKKVVLDQIATIQRLSVYTGNYDLMKSFATFNEETPEKLIKSGVHIARRSKESFISDHLGVYADSELGTAELSMIYNNAVYHTLFSKSHALNLYSSQMGNPAALYGDGMDVTVANPDWETLFGSPDYCTCDQCQSVYSASAYLVDTLEMLRNNNPDAYNKLLQKRPDIFNIKLTCKNTNTPFPQIDIVNELLEDLMTSSYQSTNYNLTAHNTNLTAKELKAFPEYVDKSDFNSDAYGILSAMVGSDVSKSVYPSTLPYNYFNEQIKSYLKVIDAVPFTIAQSLGAETKISAFENMDLVRIYLNLTKEEKYIITKTWPTVGSITPPALADYYGVSSTSTIIGCHVDLFLQKTKIDFNHLLLLLDCYFINPVTGDVRDITLSPDEICDTTAITIEGLDTTNLDLIHRFIRLADKTGWSYAELDRIFAALAITDIDEDCLKKVAQIKKLTEILNCKTDDIINFWGDLNTVSYKSYDGDTPKVFPLKYEQIFLNIALNSTLYFPTTTAGFSGMEITLDEKNQLLACLNIKEADYNYLVDYLISTGDLFDSATTGILDFSFANVNTLLREVTLMRKLVGANVKDWCFIRTWLSADSPFADCMGTLTFIDKFRLIKGSGLSINQIQSIFEGAIVDPKEENKKLDEVVSQMLALRTKLAAEKAYSPENDITGQIISKKIKALSDEILKEYKTNPALITVPPTSPPFVEADISNRIDFMINKVILYDFINPPSGFILDNTARTTFHDYCVDLRIDSVVADTLADDFVGTYSGSTFTLTLNDDIIDKLTKLFNVLVKPIMIDVAENYFASLLKLDLNVTKQLLTITNIGTVNSLPIILDDLYIDDIVKYDITWLASSSIAGNLSQLQLVAEVFIKIKNIAQLINTYNLTTDDNTFIAASYTTLGIPDIFDLPYPTPWTSTSTSAAPGALNTAKFLQFVSWMQLNAHIDTVKPAKSSPGLFKIIDDTIQATGAEKAQWFNSISYTLQLTNADLEVLVGVSSTDYVTPFLTLSPPPIAAGNILDLDFAITATPPAYLNPSTYWRVMDAVNTSGSLECDMLSSVLIANSIINPTDQAAVDIVINVVKAGYSSQEWVDILGPINDRLRLGRKNAMIDYLLANPVHGYTGVWETADDIYETLLIDVQIMPCVMTSRIRAAMSSVQLFIERCLMNLEKNGSDSILLNSESARQWNQWRKYYRVWEANRKVFLYPENWIEPELRDNKTPFFIDLEKYLKQNEITPENMEEAYLKYIEQLETVSHLDIVGTYVQKTDSNEANDIVHVWGRTRQQPHLYFYRYRKEGEWNPWEKMDVQIDGDTFIPVLFRGRLRFYWLIFTDIQSTDKSSQSAVNMQLELAWSELKNKKWQPKQIGKDKILFGNNDKELNAITRAHIIAYCYKNNDGELEFLIEDLFPYTGTYPNGSYNYSFDWTGSVAPKHIYMGKFIVKHNGIIKYREPALSGAEVDVYPFPSSTLTAAIIPNSVYRRIPDSSFKQQTYYYNFIDIETNGYKHNEDENKFKLLSKLPHFIGQVNNKFVFQKAIYDGVSNFDTGVYFHKFFYQDYQNSFFIEKIAEKVSYTFNQKQDPFKGLLVNPNKGFGFTETVYSPHYYINNYFRFHTFYHYNVNQFGEQLFTKGIDGLLNLDFVRSLNDSGSESIHFESMYAPTNNIVKYWPTKVLNSENYAYPTSKVDFSLGGAFSIYNWELFFHIPMLIANKLMQDQKFYEAMKWFQYVFNPTTTDSLGGSERFWRFLPFHEESQRGIPTLQKIMESPDLDKAVKQWANNPFKPHLVARGRISAYMKNAVMKYLDNLIAWGDMKFRQNTMETINEATLLYVTAAKILGRAPVKIPSRNEPTPKSYLELSAAGLNAFSNAIVEVETILSSTLTSNYYDDFANTDLTEPDPINIYYFCLPPNTKLFTYWDTIADRLFKIRHCQNIDGVEQQLALFDPPIDPAMLVRAAASGMSLSDAINEMMSPLPHYKFAIMLQKATELTQEVKSFGASLLSAIEKRDSEHLALLRNTQEQTILNAVLEVKTAQLEEAAKQIEVLNLQMNMVSARKTHYDSLISNGLIVSEQLQLASLGLSIPLKYSQGLVSTLGGVLGAIPNFNFGPHTPTAVEATFSFGGSNLASIANAVSTAIGTVATINDIAGSMAGIVAGHQRRKQDWELQQKLTTHELTQITKQIEAAQIRRAIAENELSNHNLQIQNAQEMDRAMHDKFSNEELYDWMVGEISVSYFQMYKLAFDVAKRAERCYRYELGIDDTNFINFGYWDSLKKGLLAGEGLMYDIKRMDVSYLDQNKRQHEITKHISLASFDAEALLKLRSGVGTDLELPEWLFDMDYPGHYERRIKSISISIPCIAGPYTTVSAKLTLQNSKYRNQPLVVINTTYSDAPNYKFLFGGGESIATSSAQNDSGMFELNFRDERFLPFEGQGVISNWRLDLPAAIAQFDYNTISDVIIHVKYTAKYNAGLEADAKNYLNDILDGTTINPEVLPRIFSLKHEFASEWFAYVNDVVNGVTSPEMSFNLNHKQFPFYCNNKTISISNIVGCVISKATSVPTIDIVEIDGNNNSGTPVGLSLTPGSFGTMLPFGIAMGDNKEVKINLASGLITDIDDIIFIPIYKLI